MKTLLLAGTSDARRVAQGLSGDKTINLVASLAGVTRHPTALGCPTVTGGFGGDAGYRRFLAEEQIETVIDATHPFAVNISHRAARVSRALGLSHVLLLRPAWAPGAGDNWVKIAAEADVAGLVKPGSNVFLATGRQTLDAFENLSHATLFCRQIDPATRPFPFPNGEFLIGRPPFSVNQEETLFRRLGIDWLVVKNSGAEASMSKLVAARNLGIPVAMIARPPQPRCERVASAAEAIDWARRQGAQR